MRSFNAKVLPLRRQQACALSDLNKTRENAKM